MRARLVLELAAAAAAGTFAGEAAGRAIAAELERRELRAELERVYAALDCIGRHLEPLEHARRAG